MNLDGSDLINISNNNDKNLYPRFSKSGNYITFTCNKLTGIDSICLYDVQNRELRYLEYGWSPSISFNESFVAFQTYDDSTIYDISKINIDGTKLSRIADTQYREYEPVCSPTNELITYMSNEDIFIIDSTGNNKQNLTNNNLREILPAFSPQGDKIVFIIETDSYYRQINIMNIDGSNKINISGENRYDTNPRFSPDGKKIVCNTVLSNSDIIIMDTNGDNRINLTDDINKNIEPSFNEDGSKIVYISDRNGNFDIFLMNLDGSNKVNISKSYADERFPTIFAY